MLRFAQHDIDAPIMVPDSVTRQEQRRAELFCPLTAPCFHRMSGHQF